MCLYTSGVAVLSCTDCSGSSTASSDITDPGSPYSDGSTHSEDSGTHQKMPPTQCDRRPSWPWTAGEDSSPPLKRPSHEKTPTTTTACFPNKRMKISAENCLLTQLVKGVMKVECGGVKKGDVDVVRNKDECLKGTASKAAEAISSCRNEKLVKMKTLWKSVSPESSPKMQQGKITEYFKSQMKCNGIKKEIKATEVKPVSCPRKIDTRSTAGGVKKTTPEPKSRLTVPRKILPAPSKVQVPSCTMPNPIPTFHPNVTLTTVGFPYLHTKIPKPPEPPNIFVQQFTTITNNRTCLLQTAVNNFVKLNGTVVPIVKLGTMTQRINGLNVINTVPTVVPTKFTEVKQQQQQQAYVVPSPIAAVPTIVASNPPRTASAEEQLLPVQDSDSGIASPKDRLEVCCVEPSTVVECQKSPILSQPKTIRFPAKKSEKDEQQQRQQQQQQQQGSPDVSVCRWDGCHAQFDTSGALFEHLQVKHVISQATQEQYNCLWSGCRVHGRMSCSRSWLERHVPAHAGTKPFRCIVDGCGLRFNSQLILERHVNNHFNGEGSQNGSGKKSVESGSGSAKLLKRNGKKIRFRRQPWSARMFDFIDSGIMEGLQHRLLTMTERRTLGQIEGIPGDNVCLQSQILARRIEPDGKRKFLLRWHPADVVPDEWVDESSYVPRKTVRIPALRTEEKGELAPVLFGGASRRKRGRKQQAAAT